MSINKKIILDVRTAEEFSQGSVPGSINIPIQDLQQNIDVLPSLNKNIRKEFFEI